MEKKSPLKAAIAAAGMALCATPAVALEPMPAFELDGGGTVGLSGGLRVSGNWFENLAGEDNDKWSSDFIVNRADVRTSFQSASGFATGVINLSRIESPSEFESPGLESSSDVDLLDGYARLKFADAFQVVAGRYNVATDRNRLADDFGQLLWEGPSLAIFNRGVNGTGRDDGVGVFGRTGMFEYAVNIFEGQNTVDDNPAVSGRFALNFGDEEPDFYRPTSYYGEKNITSVGIGFERQKNAILGETSLDNAEDYVAWNIDFLFERVLGNGSVFTVDAAYYDYDTNDVDTGNAFGQGLAQGDGFYATFAYLFGNDVGPGKFQPVFRWQRGNIDDITDLGGDVEIENIRVDQYELGLSYIVEQNDAKVQLVWGNLDPRDGDSTNFVQLGIQVQINQNQ